MRINYHLLGKIKTAETTYSKFSTELIKSRCDAIMYLDRIEQCLELIMLTVILQDDFDKIHAETEVIHFYVYSFEAQIFNP